MAAHIATTMSGLCAVGGLMGYIRKRSLPSLVAGSAFAFLFASSSYLISNNLDSGLQLATLTSALLTFAMGRRAFKSRGGLIPTLLSTAGLGSSAYYAYKWYRESAGF